MTTHMPFRKTRVLLGSSLIAVASFACAAAVQVPVDTPPAVPAGVLYLSGGNSEDSMKAMLTMADSYNVRLTMVDVARGEPLEHTSVLVTGADGHPLLMVVATGPMFYLRLPAGAYWLAIGYDGWVKARDIVVDTEALDLTFRLPVDPSSGKAPFSETSPLDRSGRHVFMRTLIP
ncbi:carboxypeptidase regulatory-like domain-containing protein [Cupriavidus gilardii]|uniref:carboxypeptidase regulatory-like domain-containing protein n=1 Tax=Cupriavidus gilardii TaxID=82541 RepID=UPI001EE57B2E|nr:carboxypeptidase regulatory-like domain-containing protein [Cupriavidus gilardii]MCG5262766.1 carboxypeptidase regulatory-like domain-containing protein [Cupriavidus gilardii]